MLWKTTRQTLLAAVVIGVLAGAWQLVAESETPVSPAHYQNQSERAYHDDD